MVLPNYAPRFPINNIQPASIPRTTIPHRFIQQTHDYSLAKTPDVPRMKDSALLQLLRSRLRQETERREAEDDARLALLDAQADSDTESNASDDLTPIQTLTRGAFRRDGLKVWDPDTPPSLD